MYEYELEILLSESSLLYCCAPDENYGIGYLQMLETEGHGRFDVSTMPSGVYFVEVETDRGVFVRKLVVH